MAFLRYIDCWVVVTEFRCMFIFPFSNIEKLMRIGSDVGFESLSVKKLSVIFDYFHLITMYTPILVAFLPSPGRKEAHGIGW